MTIEELTDRVIYLEAIVKNLGVKYNAHTHGGVATGSATSAATAAGSQIDTTFTLNELL
jgi:hypothetical protein